MISLRGLFRAIASVYRELVLKRSRDQQFWILSAFIPTFCIARLIVYLFPNLHLQAGGSHIHHFTYGFVLLAITGFIAIVQDKPASRWLAMVYGLGLALAVDEVGIWLRLQAGGYYSRQSYDAVVLVAAVLISATYFASFWQAVARTLIRWMKKPF
jgi:hypothetical protein